MKSKEGLEKLRTDFTAKDAELASRIAEERTAREAADTASVSLIEGATVGGLGGEFVGWIWLLFATQLDGMQNFCVRLLS
jgi:hypothetical protein